MPLIITEESGTGLVFGFIKAKVTGFLRARIFG